jgi:glucosyl-dolichyl phosphate glucuronosyltransferase
MNLPSISVVICAYTEARWADLMAALASLAVQRTPPLEIIVVVDHNPGLLARLRARVPNIVTVENGEARGLSGARNTGIRVAQGAVLAFLDDDAVAAPHWLERLGAAYAEPRVLGVGGAIEPLWTCGQPGWFPPEFLWVVGCTYRGMPEQVAPVRNLIGANMSFRREVFESVGGFRNGIGRRGTRPLGCEETELCIRATRCWPGRILLYEPRARVAHRVSASRAVWGYFRARCYAEGLSKALVARSVGVADGLAAERIYTLRALPRGVASALATTIRDRDPCGLAQAGAIVAGLATTTAGYLVGRTASPRAIRPADAVGHRA